MRGKIHTVENKIRKLSRREIIEIYLERKNFSGDSRSIIVQAEKKIYRGFMNHPKLNLLYLTKPDLESSLGYILSIDHILFPLFKNALLFFPYMSPTLVTMSAK